MRGGRFSKDERGSVAFFVVGTFLILLLFVGVATDFGIVLRYRRAMQNACDTGVLAGAQDLRSTTRVATVTAQTYTAQDLTENNFAVNNFQGGGWQYQAQTQDANGNATGITPVRLGASIQTTVPLFFLKLVRPSLPVAVQCAAQRVPVETTGMKPLGLNADVYQSRWQAQGNQPCPIFGASGNPNPFGSLPCGDCALSININGGGAQNSSGWCDTASPGSGNSGALALQNTQAGCTNSGYSTNNGWGCTFVNGTGTNPAYCATPPPGGNSTNSSNWYQCSIVGTKTGMGVGPWQTAVQAVCSTPDPMTNPAASQWVVVMPLMNPSLWSGGINGTSTQIDITGFASFELDCPYMAKNGYEPLVGIFVNFLDVQGATGNPQGQDTGVDTIILVQ